MDVIDLGFPCLHHPQVVLRMVEGPEQSLAGISPGLLIFYAAEELSREYGIRQSR